MTKVIKWYQKYNTWNTVLMVLTPISSGELIAFFANIELPSWVHVVVGLCAGVVLYLKMFMKDENHNGIIDQFEKK